jgi:hypothetical protein
MEKETHILYLEELLSDSDYLSGRKFSKNYTHKENILGRIMLDHKIHIEISDKIKFISDSFWKGFFNDICKKYRNGQILNIFSFSGNKEMVDGLIENLKIIDLIHHSK